MDRERNAVAAVRAFSIFASGKLPPHVTEDLRIVAQLADEALNARALNNTDSRA